VPCLLEFEVLAQSRLAEKSQPTETNPDLIDETFPEKNMLTVTLRYN